MADVQAMDESMAEEQPVVDKKAAKKAAKEAKKAAKAEKKKNKAMNDDLDSEEDSIGTKVATFFVTLIIILIWLGIIVMLIKWDVGGFGSGVLAPILKDVPVVNQILPQTASTGSTEDSAYAFSSIDEAVDRIKELELELAEAQNTTDADADEIADLQQKAAELEQYKADEEAFNEEKQKFYDEVVFSSVAPDIEEYKSYYESIDPATAETIYRQVVQQTAISDELSDYVKTYSSMKPKEAAAVFDTMTDNLNLVAQILENMDAQSRADILGKMDSDTAAKVTEIMHPGD
jgi:flagellar motility protein MotE (MotC chaperone)